MGFAKHSQTPSTLVTTLGILTSLAPAVGYAQHSRTLGTLVATLGMLTSLVPAVCYAKHSRTFRTLATALGMLTSLAPTMCCAKQCSSNRAFVTTLWILTSFPVPFPGPVNARGLTIPLLQPGTFGFMATTSSPGSESQSTITTSCIKIALRLPSVDGLRLLVDCALLSDPMSSPSSNRSLCLPTRDGA
jgi:hypothetical protein